MSKIIETIYEVKVLSREPIPDDCDITQVLEEAYDGEYIAHSRKKFHSVVQPTALKIKLIRSYGNDGHFFDEEEA